MKHAVFGPSKDGAGGDYSDLDHVTLWLNTIKSETTSFILGGGKGVETLAERFARDNGIAVERVAPNFHSLFGSKIKNPNVRIETLPVSLRHAVFAARNDDIMSRADRVIIFWDGEFFEIGQLIRRALSLRKPVLLFPV